MWYLQTRNILTPSLNINITIFEKTASQFVFVSKSRTNGSVMNTSFTSIYSLFKHYDDMIRDILQKRPHLTLEKHLNLDAQVSYSTKSMILLANKLC